MSDRVYSHAFDVAFEVRSPHEDGNEIPIHEVLDALQRRIYYLRAATKQEVKEAVYPPFSSCELPLGSRPEAAGHAQPTAKTADLHTRLWDLLRYCRGDLFKAELITEEEFVELMSMGSDSARRLETYDEIATKLKAVTKENTELKAKFAEFEKNNSNFRSCVALMKEKEELTQELKQTKREYLALQEFERRCHLPEVALLLDIPAGAPISENLLPELKQLKAEHTAMKQELKRMRDDSESTYSALRRGIIKLNPDHAIAHISVEDYTDRKQKEHKIAQLLDAMVRCLGVSVASDIENILPAVERVIRERDLAQQRFKSCAKFMWEQSAEISKIVVNVPHVCGEGITDCARCRLHAVIDAIRRFPVA